VAVFAACGGSAALASIVLAPPSSAFAEEETRGEKRAEKAAIRPHPGGLIQAEWLEPQALPDD
jgi:hypothetical protein